MLAFLSRILEFLVALAMLRSVLQMLFRLFGGGRGPGTAWKTRVRNPGAAAGQTTTGDPGSTLLHQDPVCGTYVASKSSFRKICRGQVMHFCSEECRDRYTG